MTDKATAIVWQESPCRGAAKLVHLAMAHCCNRAGDIEATGNQLAEMTGLDIGYVRKVLRTLLDAGLVIVARESAGRRPRLYRLVAPVASTTAPAIIEVAAPTARTKRAVRESAPLIALKTLRTKEREGLTESAREPVSLTLDVSSERGDSIERVFVAWQEAGGGARARLTAKRRKLVAARIADGYDTEQLLCAVRGVFASEWHVEHGHTGFDLVLRDGDHVERFMRYHDHPPPSRRQSRSAQATRGLLAVMSEMEER